MTKKLFLYFLILGIWYCNGHAQHVQEIKILHEDPSSITIEYTPVIKTSAYRGIDGVSYVTFKYRNVQSACSDTAGYVETYRVVPLFLPTNRCHVQIISAEAGITKELHALPVHALKKEDRLSLSHFDAVPYAEHPRAEVNAINRTSVGWVGSLKLLPVEIIDANHVKFYSKIVVQLRYAGVVGSHASALSLLSGKMPQISMSNRNTLSTKVVSSTSVAAPLSTGTWYQIAVNETGMYKLDYNFFVNSGVSAAELSNIHNLRLYGNGGKVLPVDLAAARPDSLLEIARLVVDQNGDSVFNQGDYIIFYGKSVRGWDYDAAGKTFHHYLNPYSETNYYFFTFTNGTGKDMNVEPSIISANAYQPTDFLDKVFDEQELHNIIPSGRRWLGKAYNILDNSGTYTKTLFGIVPNSSVLYRFLFLDRSLTNDQFSVSETGTTLVTWILPSMSSVDLSGPYSNVNEYAEETPVITATKNWNLSGETSSLNVSYTAGNSSAIGWIDWLEILYHRQFKAVNDSLLFTSPDTNASIVYSISNLSSSASTKVFDVSDHFNVQQISQVDVSVASTVKFGLTQTSGNVSSFAVIGPNGYKTISAPAVQVENTTLHASTNAYDFLIISPKDFLAQADRLRDYRIAHDTLRTLVVDINNIYHEFSSGIPDVMAIRNFLRYTLTNWSSAPHYILLFGWGHYDYKNITTSLPNWIPVFETQESIVQINSYASDDSLVILNAGDSRLSMSISRLPART
ncbi:MAG TPA: C25 family cysteine peptidase, partial [Bacteroidota bacterium]|nr:C25 family cysteine peptidase [Bacteroidota bacterium]